MTNIYKFLEEMNESNSSNHKLDVLKKYSDNALITRILQMTYDRVNFTYGISYNTIKDYVYSNSPSIGLPFALDELSKLARREITGQSAADLLKRLISELCHADADIIKKIIDRDLQINAGKTQINKVHTGLIVKPTYMRCGTFNEKTSKKIKFPALLQLKADGSYREFVVNNQVVTCNSRSGESYEYPDIFQEMEEFPDGHYHGELTVIPDQILMDTLLAESKGDEKINELYDAFRAGELSVLPRDIGNGLINSSNPPFDNIVMDLWDYVTPEEHANALNKIKNETSYEDRFNSLIRTVTQNNCSRVSIIEYEFVNSIKDALKITSGYMKRGLEGSVLKNLGGVFRDGTSPDQLKLKLKMQAEVRIAGFTAGTGKNADYFGAITFVNDEGTVKGQVGVSSMSEKIRNEIHANRESYLGKVMEVEFNDISKAEGSSTYAFSHPRFIEVRNDKDETDSLEKIFEIRESAMNLE